MKITEENYDKFYFGNSNECYIQGEFYSHGYEAAKLSPDIGYDLIVTNCARTRFLKETPKQFNIQIKSTVYNKNGYCLICIGDDDLKMLCDDKNGYLICVLCEPEFAPVGKSLHVSRDSVDDAIQKDLDTRCISEWNDAEYVSLKQLKEYETWLNLVGFSRSYVWFNNSHIKRLKEIEAIWDDNTYKNTVWKLYLKIDGEELSILDKEKNTISSAYGLSSETIGYELRKITYLGNERIGDLIFQGDRYL